MRRRQSTWRSACRPTFFEPTWSGPSCFGSLVGNGQGLRYDEELFFLGAVLHDLGLTPEFQSTQRFEVAGTDGADAFLKGPGVAPNAAKSSGDAIALHTSIEMASRKRPEIALVHIGAGVDVLGIGLDALPPTLVAEAIEALPRHDFKNTFPCPRSSRRSPKLRRARP